MKPIQSMKAATDDAPYVVEYHAYDLRLPVFEKVRRLIQSVAGLVLVEHIGSSSALFLPPFQRSFGVSFSFLARRVPHLRPNASLAPTVTGVPAPAAQLKADRKR
jgi:hypothetical protein